MLKQLMKNLILNYRAKMLKSVLKMLSRLVIANIKANDLSYLTLDNFQISLSLSNIVSVQFYSIDKKILKIRYIFSYILIVI